MVALTKVTLPIGQFAPTDVPPEVFQALNDLHLAIHNLVQQISGARPVMISPNGHYWVASISNAGAVTWTDVGTTLP